MEETLAQISEALGSITYSDTRAPASSAPGDAHQQPAYAPSDRGALLRRLQMFRPATWFAKPPPLSAVACALRGWRNAGMDLLSCEFCGAKVMCRLPAVPQAESAAPAVAQYTALLTDSHVASCPWKHKGCDPTLLAYPLAPEQRLRAGFETRVAALQRLDMVPRVLPAAVAALAAAAAAAAAVGAAGGAAGSAGAGTAAAAPAAAAPPPPAATNGEEGAWGVGALAALLGMPKEQLLGSQQQQKLQGDGPPAASQQQEELSVQQQVLLLALCGWDVATLPQRSSSSNGTRVLMNMSASALTHLVQPAPAAAAANGNSSSGGERISSSEAVLRCSECGAAAGLWTFNCAGPLYLKALQSTVARLAALDPSASPQPIGVAPRASPGGDVSPGATLGSVLVTPTSAANSEHAGFSAAEGGGVVESLYQTIAGGDLVSAPRLPKRRFGSDSGNPVFGLGAFEVEAKRRRSESSGFGGSRAGSEAPSDLVSPRPEATAAGGAGDGGGVDGDSGGKAVHGLGTCEQRASTPLLPMVRQPSLLSPGSAVAAQADRPQLDPLQQHRPWCPWVHAHPGPATAGAAAAAAAAEPSCGWLQCLRAATEQSGVAAMGQPELQGWGAGGEFGGVDGADEAMQDYSAKVRSALGAMWGTQ